MANFKIIKGKVLKENTKKEFKFYDLEKELAELEKGKYNDFIGVFTFKSKTRERLNKNLLYIKRKIKDNYTYEIILNRYLELFFDENLSKYLTKHIYLDLLNLDEKVIEDKVVDYENLKKRSLGLYNRLDLAGKCCEFYLLFGREHFLKKEKVLTLEDLLFRLENVYERIGYNFNSAFLTISKYTKEIIEGYRITTSQIYRDEDNNIIPFLSNL